MSLADEDRALNSLLYADLADVLPLLRLPYFQELFPGRRKEASWLQNYVGLTNAVPSFTQFKRQFPKVLVKPTKPEPLSFVVEELRGQLIENIAATGADRMTDHFGKKDLPGFVEEAEEMIGKVRLVQEPMTSAALNVDNFSTEFLANIVKDAGAALKLVPTGFQPMDDELGGGMRKGMIITLSALVNLGKTYVACAVAENMRKAGHKVLVVPLEMTADDLALRCLCIRHKLNVDRVIRRLKPTTETASHQDWYTDLIKSVVALDAQDKGSTQGRVFIKDSGGAVTPALIKSWAQEHAVDAIIIDAAQDLWDNKKTAARVERIYSALAELNMLCKDFPLLLTVQLSADVEKKGLTKGNLVNIQWGQVFAQKSQCVFTMLGDRTTGDRELTTDKNRDGHVGRKWQISMSFPEIEITASYLQAVGIVLTEDDVFEHPGDIQKLFAEVAAIDKEVNANPAPYMIPTPMPEDAPEAGSEPRERGSAATPYQKKREEQMHKRMKGKLRRLRRD